MPRLGGLIALAVCLVVLSGAQGCSSSSSSGSATCCQATNGSVAVCACPGTGQGCTVTTLGSACKITCGADSLSGTPMASCPTPSAQAYVAATMSSAGGGSCPVAGGAGAFLTIGSGGGGMPTPVTDGSNNVSVACMVHPSGSGYDVQLTASMSGGGSVSLSGSVTASGASGVSASFSGSQGGGPYTDNNCSVAFTYMGSPVQASSPVTAGRIWGHVSCPMAAMGSNTCDAEADFLFENCAQ